MSALDTITRLYRAEESGGLPAYALLKSLVQQQVTVGAWSPGTPLPSENELVEALGLSRMTINRAYRELAQAGTITRAQGVGSFVADARAVSPLLEVRNIADEIRGRGHEHTVQVVQLGAPLPEDVDAALGATPYRSVLVHREDGVPLQLEDRLVNLEVAPDYPTQDFSRVTPHEYLSASAPITRGTHLVEAVLPSDSQAELLGIGTTEPCLLVTRRTYSGEALVSVALLLMPGARARLRGDFTR